MSDPVPRLNSDGQTVWPCRTRGGDGRLVDDHQGYYGVYCCDACHETWIEPIPGRTPPPSPVDFAPPGGYAIVTGSGDVLGLCDEHGRDVLSDDTLREKFG